MPPHSQSISVESLAEEFLERLRCGEDPSVDDYVLKYPALAEEIRGFFPALRLVENYKPDSRHEPSTGPSDRHGLRTIGTPLPSRLGDFRIVREIGRGGMGVVYEAEQESLGRLVALKVLPHALLHAPQRKRFLREARAAARLHHTNIVPVFGVGQHDGVDYYAMQFINGLGLDKVLDELRRLRAEGSGAAGRVSPSLSPQTCASASADPSLTQVTHDSNTPLSAALIAKSLTAGRFAAPPIFPAVVRAESGSIDDSIRADESISVKDIRGEVTDATSFALPGQPADSSGSGSLIAYWRSVARIGLQVAEALQYAHEHAVLHRDIKPSNLLLDARGTVWVTDFGLAKSADDQDDLTHSGDLLGTLRYMAPEMFGGRADCRSDVYSLGLTLYELLTLRPAFDETNRHKLVRQVVHESPPRLRLLERHIPRDLETIVHKAIERDPSQRYQTAAELAADLQHFLDDEPIRARPLHAIARCARWCRRNPRIAMLTSAIALLLLVLGIGGVAWAIQAESARRQIAQAEIDRQEAEVSALVEEAQRLSSGTFPDFARAVELLTLAIRQRPDDARLLLFRGSARYEQGEYVQAIADLQRSLELAPQQNPAAHWLLAMAWQQQGNETLARGHLQQAQRQQPDDTKSLVVQALAMPFDERGVDLLTEAIDGAPFDPMLHFYRGRIAYNLTVRRTAARHFRRAVGDLELALRNRPSDLRIIETLSQCLAQFYFLADDGEQALTRSKELLDQWLDKQPGDPQALSVLAKYELSSERPEKALEICLQAQGTGAQHRPLLFHLGWAYRDLSRHEQAVSAFSKAIAQQAEPAVTGELLVASYAARAHSQAALGRTQEAEQDLERALNLAPPENWLLVDWYSVISAYRQLGRFDDGLKWCQQMCQIVPDCATTWFLRATLLEELHRDREGREYFVKALECNPKYDVAHIRLLNSYLQAGEIEPALEQCDRWLTVKPNSSTALRWKGMLELVAGKPAQALASLSQAVQFDDTDARAYYYRARAYLALRQYDPAAKDFDQSLKLDASDLEVRRSRGTLHFDRGRHAEAIADFDQVLMVLADDGEIWRRRGDAFRRLGRLSEALADLNRAIHQDSQDATAYDRRGLVHFALKQHDEALADYARALEVNPIEPWTHRHIVDVHLARKDYQAAAEFCRKWADAEPDASEPHRLRAQALFSAGDHQAALDELAIAGGKNGRDADVPLLRGRIYAKLGQHAKALADFNLALELRPGYDGVYYSRGLAQAALSRFPAAVADFTRALSKSPRDGWLYYHRADAYRHLREYDQALSDATQAVECDSSNPTLYIMRGRVFAVQGRLQDALADFTRAFELNEHERYARHSIVAILCNLKLYDEATEFCDRWTRDEPTSAEAIRHQAYILHESGKYEAAIAAYNTGLALNSNDYATLCYRGMAHMALGDRQQGEADIRRSLAVCPAAKSAEHYAAVGEYFGQRGEWKLAAEHLAKSVELDPVHVRRQHLLALVQLAQGDETAYHQTVSRMLRQYAQTEDPNAAELVALTGGLRRISGDGKPWIALGNLAVENGQGNAARRCALGAVLLRTGSIEDALAQLELAEQESAQLPQAGMIGAWVSHLKALAYHELGDSHSAAEQLIKVDAEVGTQSADEWTSHIEPPQWSRRLMIDLLRREVSATNRDRADESNLKQLEDREPSQPSS